jgi:glycerol kinase
LQAPPSTRSRFNFKPAMVETTALGAAMLAALGCGLLKPQDLQKALKVQRRFVPKSSLGSRQRLRSKWQHAVTQALV